MPPAKPRLIQLDLVYKGVPAATETPEVPETPAKTEISTIYTAAWNSESDFPKIESMTLSKRIGTENSVLLNVAPMIRLDTRVGSITTVTSLSASPKSLLRLGAQYLQPSCPFAVSGRVTRVVPLKIESQPFMNCSGGAAWTAQVNNPGKVLAPSMATSFLGAVASSASCDFSYDARRLSSSTANTMPRVSIQHHYYVSEFEVHFIDSQGKARILQDSCLRQNRPMRPNYVVDISVPVHGGDRDLSYQIGDLKLPGADEIIYPVNSWPTRGSLVIPIVLSAWLNPPKTITAITFRGDAAVIRIRKPVLPAKIGLGFNPVLQLELLPAETTKRFGRLILEFSDGTTHNLFIRDHSLLNFEGN